MAGRDQGPSRVGLEALEAAEAAGRRVLRHAERHGISVPEALGSLSGPFGPEGRSKVLIAPGSPRKASEVVEAASQLLPSAWLGSIRRAGPIHVRWSRGSGCIEVRDDGSGITLTIPREDSYRVALHELVHVAEYKRRAVREAGFAFVHKWSTGEMVLVSELDPEITNRIKAFPGMAEPYAGVVYPDRSTEAVSIGIEGLLLGGRKLDIEHVEFSAGCLAAL